MFMTVVLIWLGINLALSIFLGFHYYLGNKENGKASIHK